MKLNRFLLGALASYAMVNNVYAANKTHITDTLGAGNSRMDISYEVVSLNLPGTVVYAGGTSPTLPVDFKASGSRLSAAYLLGVTDRLDVGIFIPFSESLKYTQDYTIGANKYNETSKYEGQGDVIFAAQYQVLDKQQDRASLNLLGAISPSTAPSDQGTTEVVTNGTVTTTGKTGESGNGYKTITVAATLSVPTGAADVFVRAQFDNYGERTKAGVTYKRGSRTSFLVGIENMVNEKITITPYANLDLNSASSYSSGTNIASNNSYDLGIKVTNDLSKNVSVRVGAEYNVVDGQAITYSNGSKFYFSGKGYTFGLTTMFFF